MTKEDRSILKKTAIALATRAALRALCVLPIRKNRVLFQCFREKQYACNPKYISEKLLELYGGELEIGWSFREPEKFADLKNMGVRVLQSQSKECLLFALTARVVCVNTYYKPTMPRRRGQYYIRTWHGGGAYKKVGSEEKMSRVKRAYIALQQTGADLYLSSSRAFTQMTLRDSFHYKGEVLESGMPRNDMLVNGGNEARIARVRGEIGLAEGEKLVLYAPTYRDDLQPHGFEMDYARLTGALSARFGGAWRCAYRGHNFVMYFDQTQSAKGAIDLTDYPDMQQLLLAADALVTDYSSCMWDMSLTFKPVFLYCTDLKKYTADRDFYTDIHTWPFPLAENNDQLETRVREFDAGLYAASVRAHHLQLGSYETGHAALDAARRIYEVCKGGK